MKPLWIAFFILIFGCVSCEKQGNLIASTPEESIKGTYIGTFERITSAGLNPVSNVIITFADSTWNGQSDIGGYPTLCNGTFKISDNKIVFSNICAWTTDFDWSLILSGEWEFVKNGDSLTFTKKYGTQTNNPYYDIYQLIIPKNSMKQSPMLGTWLESLKKTDTIVFLPEYDGLFPVFNLHTNFRVSDNHLRFGDFSGPYHYIVGDKYISLNWFLSSSSIFNRYYFEKINGGNEFKIENFFVEPSIALDTLTFIKIK